MLFFVVLIASSCAKQSIYDKMIDAYGGEENLKKMNSYTTVWEVDSPMRGGLGKDERFIVFPDKMRVNITTNNEVRIVVGESVFDGPIGREVSRTQGPKVGAIRTVLKRQFTPLVLRSLDKHIRMSKAEGVTILNYDDGLSKIDYYVNMNNFFIEKVIAKLEMPGRTMEFETLYSNYKPVEGVMVAHTEEKFAAGTATAVNTLKEIHLNAVIDESVFDYRLANKRQ